MEIWQYLRRGEWLTVAGFVGFVALMAGGYFYNLTFVQLGIVDLGARVVGLGEGGVAGYMAAFAVVTAGVSLSLGFVMTRRGWSESFVVKLRLAFLSVLGQVFLTALVPLIDSEWMFLAWILAASVSIGIGVPSTFGLTVDLVPVKARGSAAALITAGSFFPAAVFTSDWQIEPFARMMLPLTALGAVCIGALAWGQLSPVQVLSRQHLRPAFGQGRFLRPNEMRRGVDLRLFVAFLLMFGVYFIDSLGFLRIVVTPTLVATTWQSPELESLLFIGVFHLLGAGIAGILYGALGVRQLFVWIFGLFAMLHLGYAFDARTVPESYASLGTAMHYALVVSMYTVVNFVIWADLSSPRTIAFNTALGVALSAWMATFLSTALALRWGDQALPLLEHFNVLASIGLLFFVVVLFGNVLGVGRPKATS